jgi:hypothetical protein
MLPSETVKAIGAVIILFFLFLDVWWLFRRKKRFGTLLSLSALAMFMGFALVLQDRITEFTLNKVGTIRAAAAEASSNATEIASVKRRVEAQSATIDLVAKTALDAKSLYDSLALKNKAAAEKLFPYGV